MKLPFIDIESTCIKLGIGLNGEGYRLVGSCPFHTENRPSFNVYRDTNSWFCFSCRQGGSPYRLVSLLIDEIHSWRDFVRWYTREESLRKTPVRSVPSLARIKELLSITEVILPTAEVSQDPFLASLGVLYASEGNLTGRHIIPVTLQGKLVAYEARDFSGRLVPKTLALPRSVKIHSYLWNIDNVVLGFPIVVVEGIKDAIAVLSRGYVNTVSSFGARLTADQVALLISKSPAEVVVAYDGDIVGIEGADEAVISLLAWVRVSKITLPKDTDPWDISGTVWKKCFEDRTQVLIDDRNKKLLRTFRSKLFS